MAGSIMVAHKKITLTSGAAGQRLNQPKKNKYENAKINRTDSDTSCRLHGIVKRL
jgi:hypothetical protein